MAFDSHEQASRDHMQPLFLMGMKVLRQSCRVWRDEPLEPEVGAVGGTSVWPDFDTSAVGVGDDFRSLHPPDRHT